MANTISTLETHPQRLRIIEAIVAGRPYSEIEAWSNPPVNRGALSRFKRRAIAVQDQAVKDAKIAIANNDKGLDAADLPAVQRLALSAAADPFILRALKSDARRESWMVKAENKEDYRTLASLDRNDLTSQEFQARLAGRLESVAPQTNIMIVVPAGLAHGSEIDRTAEPVTIDIGHTR